MPTNIKLPKLSQTMEEATIVRFHVTIGDKVNKGDIIFEIETDKATVQVESVAEGFVKHLAAPTGRTLPVGELVLILGRKDENVALPPTGSTETVNLPCECTQCDGNNCDCAIDDENPDSPVEITSPDTISKIKLGDIIPINRLQKITAQKMLRSKQRIPCFYLNVRADVTELADYRTKLNNNSSIKIAYNDFIIRAAAIAIEHFPVMAGQLEDENIRIAEDIGIGLAIAVPDGLVAPVIKSVQKKDIWQIAADRQQLAQKAHENKLSITDLQGGNITVSNLGAFGVESFIPIVVPGQCSILGLGQITDTPVPDDGSFTIRKTMSLTLAVDHTIANGAYAAKFLDIIRKTLENPANFK